MPLSHEGDFPHHPQLPIATPITNCFCGHRRWRVNTLQYDLHRLIHRHGLPEVFDRLADMIDRHSEYQDPAIEQHWRELVRLMEQATEQSLTLATLYEEEDKVLWD